MSQLSTYTLYGITSIVAILFAKLSQEQKKGYIKFKKSWFILCFSVLWFISSFTNIGVDYDAYIRIISVSGVNSTWQGEIGFNYLCAFFKLFLGTNYDGVIFLLKTITLVIFFKAFYELRNDIRIVWAVFAFLLLSYFRFYLIAMHLSCALVLLSIVSVYKEKNRRAMFLYCLAVLIHYSAIMLFPAFIFYFILNKVKKLSKAQIFLLIITYLLVFVFAYQIYNVAVNNFAVFQNYQSYGAITDYSGIGIMQIVFYIPIFYFVFNIYRGSEDKKLINLSLIFSLTGFLFALLGYRLEVISRMYEHFLCIYIIIIPVFLENRQRRILVKKKKYLLSVRDDKIVWAIYLLFRGSDVLIDIFQKASSADLSSWVFFWPF